MRIEYKFEFKQYHNDMNPIEGNMIIVVGADKFERELDIVQVSKALKAAVSAFTKEVRNR